VPVRVDRVGFQLVRIDEGGVGAVHGDVHVHYHSVNQQILRLDLETGNF
jgi:hypothetical protein